MTGIAQLISISPIQVKTFINDSRVYGKFYTYYGCTLDCLITEEVDLYPEVTSAYYLGISTTQYLSNTSIYTHLILSPGNYTLSIFHRPSDNSVNAEYTGTFYITNGNSGPIIYTSTESVYFCAMVP